jgi:GcrA cell cycle regulator
MRADLWTDERVAALRLWWSEGATATAIAERLGGVSRSAVLGKIFRLRLAAAATTAATTAAEKAAPDVSSPAALARRPRGRRKKSPQIVHAATRRRGKSLLELKNDSCRWPFGRPGTPSFFFCGAPGADLERGMPYCAVHARRAYRSGESVAEATLTAAAASADRESQTKNSRRRRAAPDGTQPSAMPRNANERIDGRSVAR